MDSMSYISLVSVLLFQTTSCRPHHPSRTPDVCQGICDNSHFLCLRLVESVSETFTCADTRNLCFRCCHGHSYDVSLCSKFLIPFTSYHHDDRHHFDAQHQQSSTFAALKSAQDEQKSKYGALDDVYEKQKSNDENPKHDSSKNRVYNMILNEMNHLKASDDQDRERSKTNTNSESSRHLAA